MLSVSDKRNFLVCIFCVFYFLCISSCILYCVVASICKMLLPGLVGAICRQLKLPADKIWQHGRSSKSDQATVFSQERNRFISTFLPSFQPTIYKFINFIFMNIFIGCCILGIECHNFGVNVFGQGDGAPKSTILCDYLTISLQHRCHSHNCSYIVQVSNSSTVSYIMMIPL